MPSSSSSALRHSQYLTYGQKVDQKTVSASIKVADLKPNEAAKAAYDALRKVGMPPEVTFEGFLKIYTLGMDEDNMDGSSTSKGLEELGLVRVGNSVSGAGGNALSNGRRPKLYQKGIEWKKNKPHSVISQHLLEVENEENSEGQGKQKWHEVLDVLSERLVGRREVARVRAAILESSKGDDRSPFVANPKRAAEKRRESLYRMLESAEKEWEIENGQLTVLDRRKKDLEKDEAEKRRLLLLLSILERMETARMRRISSVNLKGKEKDVCGLGDLIKASRVEATIVSQEFIDELTNIQKMSSVALPPSFSSQLKRLQQFPQLSYFRTTNTLANLHAYHIRLKNGLNTTTSVNNDVDAGERLENALKALDVSDVQETKRKLITLARRQAERRKKFTVRSLMKLPEAQVTDQELGEMQQSNEQKRREVHKITKQTVALGWVCDSYIDLVSTFRAESAPILEEAMEEERKRVEGYVDKIQVRFLETRRKADHGFSQKVREIMGTSRKMVWEVVEDELRRWSPEKYEMDLRGSTEELHPKMDVSDLSQLLERKIQKTKYGYLIAQDIRTLLEGHRKLKYI